MINESKIQEIIDVLKKMDVDGETMEYIIEKVGMSDQMLRQLIMKADDDIVDYIIEEKFTLIQ